MDSLLEFYNYLKFPSIKLDRESNISDNTKSVLSLFAFIFSLEIILLFPLLGLLGADNFPHAMEALSENTSSWLLALLAIIIAPIAEELIFRYPLNQPVVLEVYRILFFTAVSYMIVLAVLPKLALGFCLLVLVINVVWLINRIKKEKAFLSNQWRFYPHHFYLVAVIFAFVHLFNFDLSQLEWWMGPLLVAPQFILALLLGFVRIKYGILYSVLIHAVNNSIPMLLLTLFDVTAK